MRLSETVRGAFEKGWLAAVHEREREREREKERE